MGNNQRKICFILLLFCLITVVYSATDPDDLKILNDFRKGLENPELLKWPDNGDDPCGSPLWPHVFCSGNRVSQIQVQRLGLKGTLPQNLNHLSMLSNLGLQGNHFNGKLPTFRGLSSLQFAYLDENEFDTIPYDFFVGLTNIRVISLDHNPLNKSTGWSLPNELQESLQLTNLSLVKCNLVGPVPDFLGKLASLTALKLSYNKLSGGIPASFGGSSLQILWLNNQDGGGMNGPIDVVTAMASLTQLWLHGNGFAGSIPDDIGGLSSLKDLNLNGNQLIGLVPASLANMELQVLDLNNNLLMGPIPKFKSSKVSYLFNKFCQSELGLQCAPEVTALLDFLGAVNYPSILASEWSGNDPCKDLWKGLSCNPNSFVDIINLSSLNLNGSLSPSLAKLDSLIEIRLGGNNLIGPVPSNFTSLKSLRLLDLSGNNFSPPLPKFGDSVRVLTDGNPLFTINHSLASPPPFSCPSPFSSPSPEPSQLPPNRTSSGRAQPPSAKSPPSPIRGSNSNSSTLIQVQNKWKDFKRFNHVLAVAAIAAFAILVILSIILSVYCCKKTKRTSAATSAIVVHPRDPYDPEEMIKITVLNNSTGSLFTKSGTSYKSSNSNGVDSCQLVQSGNIAISVQVLLRGTNNFAPENELGRGGFGTVYMGELDEGRKVAVKRMEAGGIGNKGFNEFESEIAVLTMVRHRHLVSLLGYAIEDNERLLVYEYMPQGALSKHLFKWKNLNLEPLSWTRRLSIALDVARGIEYLHNLAHQSFIHRDLKSSNILLGDDFRAKVSDFGLVKLVPDREKSVMTKLAGTFGYLAPEYAVMGKVTTKSDVFSFGVVLMELLTGMMALDEDRAEDRRYLAEWFWRNKTSNEKIMASIDPALGASEETYESIIAVAELAGHCTARDPSHRPDMGYAVSLLTPLVEKWIPVNDETEDDSGIDYGLPLPQMLKVWQETEGKDASNSSLCLSLGSIPARPPGFAESFTSADAR